MRFNIEQRPHAILATRGDRHPATFHAKLDGDHLVVTDGVVLAAIKVERDPEDVDGLIPEVVLRQAKRAPKSIRNRIVALGNKLRVHDLETIETVRPTEEQAGEFPNWRQVVPPFKFGDPNTTSIGLDPTKLLALAQALGTEQVVLTWDPTSTSPTVVVTAISKGRGRHDQIEDESLGLGLMKASFVQPRESEDVGLISPVRVSS